MQTPDRTPRIRFPEQPAKMGGTFEVPPMVVMDRVTREQAYRLGRLAVVSLPRRRARLVFIVSHRDLPMPSIRRLLL